MINEPENKELSELLKGSLVPTRDTELRCDLWPQMLKTLSQQHTIRVPWFDWTLAAILIPVLVVFPGAIPALLYHL